jgi:galactose-1-phosphate uridylyltransferase
MLILHVWLCSQVNPDYEGTYLFNNDFPALLQDTPAPGKKKISTLVFFVTCMQTNHAPVLLVSL